MSIVDGGGSLERHLIEVALAADAQGITRKALREAAASAPDEDFARALEHLETSGRLVSWARRYYALEHSSWRVGRLRRIDRRTAVVRTDDGGREMAFEVRGRDRGAARAGDRVLIRPLRGSPSPRRQRTPPTATVVRVLERGHRRLVGQLRRRRGGWRLLTWDREQAVDARELEIESGDRLADGLWVVVEVTKGRHPGAVTGEVVETLGRDGEPGTDLGVLLRHHQIPERYPADALDEAASLPRKVAADELRRRRDGRQRCVVTIDGDDARDFDDAISVERTESGYLVAIHVADVAHYVTPGGALDREARRRGTSVYFPERAIHMLPDTLSEDLCSLRPDRDRLTMTVEAELTADGELLRSEVFESIIRSRRRLTYSQVEELFRNDHGDAATEQGGPGSFEAPVYELLQSARELASVLHRRRLARGGLDFDLPVSELEVDERGEIVEYRAGHRLESHRLIEELMVLANSIVAQRLAAASEQRRPPPVTLFRVHAPPPVEDLEAIEKVAREIGWWSSERSVAAEDLGELLERARDSEHSGLVTLLAMRALQRALYQRDAAPHFALALETYCHFTSPIRRYPDLVMHRRLKELAAEPEKGEEREEGEEGGDELGAEQSRLERRAEAAELELRHWRKLRFLRDKVGFTYPGRITGVQDFGLFVLLDELLVDGLVPLAGLSDDEYQVAEEGHRLVGPRSRRSFRLGDRIETVVVEVQVARRRLVLGVVGMRRQRRPREERRGRRRGPSRSSRARGSGTNRRRNRS